MSAYCCSWSGQVVLEVVHGVVDVVTVTYIANVCQCHAEGYGDDRQDTLEAFPFSQQLPNVCPSHAEGYGDDQQDTLEAFQFSQQLPNVYQCHAEGYGDD